MPPTVDNQEEARLIAAVKRAVDLVDAGDSPDDAIEKVAREKGFGPGKIRLIASAYNTGRQTSQWRGDGNILDKLASFPLADADRVIGKIYGDKPCEKMASVDPDYNRPPDWLSTPAREKKASYALPELPRPEPYAKDPMEALHKAYGQIQRNKQAVDEMRRAVSGTEDAVRHCVARLVGYFKQASHDRLPFEQVEAASRSYFGSSAGPLLDMVYAQARLKEKRAGEKTPLLKQAMNLDAAPFVHVRDAIDTARLTSLGRTRLAEMVAKEASMREELLRPFSKAGAQTEQPQGPWDPRAADILAPAEKKAFGLAAEVGAIAAGDILAHKATHGKQDTDPYGDVSSLNEDLGTIDAQADAAMRAAAQRGVAQKVKSANLLAAPAVGALVGSMLSRGVGAVPKTKDDMVDAAVTDLEDPEHHNELRKIKAHATLNSLMTDPDDPISGHDPDKVLAAFNEISQLSPRAADNAAALKPLLRKRLEGNVEPFEAKELTDIEKNLTQSKSHTLDTNIMGHAKKSCLL